MHTVDVVVRRAGLSLRGRIEKKTDGSCPLVMLLHGFAGRMASAKDEWMQQISDRLTDAGYATLQFDFNGHGSSDGEFSEMTVFGEIEDAAAFLQYAYSFPWVTTISILGHSQGGVVGGILAGLYPDRVHRLALLCPAASMVDDAWAGRCFEATYDTEHIPDTIDVGMGRLVGGLLFREIKLLPLHEMTAHFHGPTLLVCAGQDHAVSEDGIRKYLRNAEKRTFLRFEHLNHGLGNDASEMADMVRTITAFLLAP